MASHDYNDTTAFTKASLVPVVSQDGATLHAELHLPPDAKGLVIFVCDAGIGKLHSQTTYVTRKLERYKLATLMIDLLTEPEGNEFSRRADITLLRERLIAVTNWAADHRETKHLPIGYYGIHSGAAATIEAAIINDKIKAILSRRGRLDLIEKTAAKLTVPALFIIGERDYGVRDTNQQFFNHVQGTKELIVLPRTATDLFKEQEPVEQLADIATEWFYQYLVD